MEPKSIKKHSQKDAKKYRKKESIKLHNLYPAWYGVSPNPIIQVLAAKFRTWSQRMIFEGWFFHELHALHSGRFDDNTSHLKFHCRMMWCVGVAYPLDECVRILMNSMIYLFPTLVAV